MRHLAAELAAVKSQLAVIEALVSGPSTHQVWWRCLVSEFRSRLGLNVYQVPRAEDRNHDRHIWYKKDALTLK